MGCVCRKHWGYWVCAVVAWSAISTRPGSAQPALSASGFAGALVTRGEQVLESENADRLFVPASVQKLVLAAAALHHLGPEHRLVTRLRGEGALAAGILAGDLVVDAAADPTACRAFNDQDPDTLWHSLAQQLWDRGVRQVTGNLIVDTGAFPGFAALPSRQLGEVGYGLGAPTSALAAQENTTSVRITPGNGIGAPVRLEVLEGDSGVRFDNRMVTVAADRHGNGSVEFLPRWGEDVVLVRGEFPISEGAMEVAVAVPDPDRRAGLRLLAAVRARGITVGGELAVRGGRRAAGAPAGVVLAELASPPLRERLLPILTESNNWHAEMLLRALAREVEGEGRIDLGRRVVEDFLVDVAGVPRTGFALEDGSGLSSQNLLTPAAVVAVLRHAWGMPWRPALLDALPRRGQGTLAVWSGLPVVAAKTGTLRHSLGLAGYVLPAQPDAPPIVFVYFVNHHPASRAPVRRAIAQRLRQLAAGL